MNGFEPPARLNRVLSGPVHLGTGLAESLLNELIDRSKLVNTNPDNRLFSILTTL